jgi:hypothetical protein
MRVDVPPVGFPFVPHRATIEKPGDVWVSAGLATLTAETAVTPSRTTIVATLEDMAGSP